MLKEIIGAVSVFFVMLPFLLINKKILKVEKQSRFAFLFLIVNLIQAAALTLMAYSLYTIGQKTLIGMIIVFSVYIFIFLILFFSRKRTQGVQSMDEEEEIFQTQRLDRSGLSFNDEATPSEDEKVTVPEEDLILEDDEATLGVQDPDFSKIEKKEVKKTLEDIFKEM